MRALQTVRPSARVAARPETRYGGAARPLTGVMGRQRKLLLLYRRSHPADGRPGPKPPMRGALCGRRPGGAGPGQGRHLARRPYAGSPARCTLRDWREGGHRWQGSGGAGSAGPRPSVTFRLCRLPAAPQPCRDGPPHDGPWPGIQFPRSGRDTPSLGLGEPARAGYQRNGC